MEDSQKQFKPETTAEKAQESIEKILNEIDLISYLPQDTPDTTTVAILGAGGAVEIGAIVGYFSSKGLRVPRIICFDLDPIVKTFTDALFGASGINFEYRTKDIVDPRTFESEQYDMVIVRKPDIHKGEGNWEKAFKNGFDHLKNGGVFLATTDLYAAFIQRELARGGNIVREYKILDRDVVAPSFTEVDLFIAKKV